MQFLFDFPAIGGQIAGAVGLLGEVVEVHEEFDGGYGTSKTTCDLIHEVDEGATEALEVPRPAGGSTECL